ncbi:MAG: DUF2164 domain-containing protein [Sulfurimonas sp.]
MKKLEFTIEQKEHIVYKIKHYFNKELNEEIGQFDAEFLLEFFAHEIGPYYYNQGLQDATKIIEEQTDRTKEALYTMEEPII